MSDPGAIPGRPSNDAPAAGVRNHPSNRLNTWKEIAHFIGRDERTAKRWERTRGMPVRRAPGGARSMVYTYVDELEAWLAGAATAEPGMPNGAGGGQAPPVPPDRRPASSAPSSTPPEAPPEPHSARAAAEPSPRPVATSTWRVGAAAVLIGALLLLLLAVVRPVLRITHIGGADEGASPSPGAREAYLEGVYAWDRRTPRSLDMAKTNFQRAITLDPRFAPAYAGLANTYNLLRQYSGMPAGEAYPLARAAAVRAISLNDQLPSGHLALGFEEFYWEWNYSAGIGEFRRALTLAPDSALAHHWYAVALMYLGRFRAAETEIQRAEQLDPTETTIKADKELIVTHLGDLQTALKALLAIEAADPEAISPHRYLSDLYFLEGNDPAFLDELSKSATLAKDLDAVHVADMARLGLAQGARRGMLDAMLGAQLQLFASKRIPAYRIAQTCGRMGRTSGALKYLLASGAAHEELFISFPLDPAMQLVLNSPQLNAFQPARQVLQERAHTPA